MISYANENDSFLYDQPSAKGPQESPVGFLRYSKETECPST